MNDLKKHRILDHLLRVQYPEYTLRIVGHSLGAGCAVLLATMLRKEYPSLRCLAFSPPGGCCTYDTATNCKNFVTSYILNSDLVPRLSVENMEKLRDEILTILGQINVPKLNVVRSIFDQQNTWKNMLQDIDDECEYAQKLLQFKKIQQERKNRRRQRNVSLFPPGKIVHLVKKTNHGSSLLDSSRINRSDLIPTWAENNDFNEIVVTPTMGIDHFPNRVCLQLEELARSFGVDIG